MESRPHHGGTVRVGILSGLVTAYASFPTGSAVTDIPVNDVQFMRGVFGSIKGVKKGDYRPSEYTRDASLDKAKASFASKSPSPQRGGDLCRSW